MTEEEMFSDIIEAFKELQIDEVIALVKQKLEKGVKAQDILHKGLIPGLREVGAKFERYEYFLSDLLMAGEIMKKCMEILNPILEKSVEKMPSMGKLLIGTVKGDIHDIGKNLFATLMRAAGFEVYDIGVDVPSEKFVEKVKEIKPDILGMSALLSTTAPYFKVVIEDLKKNNLRDKIFVMIGGPPLVTAEEVGADVYCNDAFKGVEYALDYIKRVKQSSISN